MQNISIAALLPIALLDSVAKTILGAACAGVSVKEGAAPTSKIHLADASGSNPQIAGSILSSWNTLLVTTNKATMVQGDVAGATISHTVVTGDTQMDYHVTLDGVLYSAGVVNAVAGVCTLNLPATTAGSYVVLLGRKVGNYATGQVFVEVTES